MVLVFLVLRSVGRGFNSTFPRSPVMVIQRGVLLHHTSKGTGRTSGNDESGNRTGRLSGTRPDGVIRWTGRHDVPSAKYEVYCAMLPLWLNG